MCVVGVGMASDDVAQLADSLARTQVGEGELSYKSQGLKLDNAESGENNTVTLLQIHTVHEHSSVTRTALCLYVCLCLSPSLTLSSHPHSALF